MRYIPAKGRKLRFRNQLGITGLETAIVLIAFVVVSSVFAFAALSTGLFSADKSKEVIQQGLGEAQGSLEVKGGVQINTSSTGSLTNQTGITTGGTAFTLSKTPVIPGSETITVDSSVLTLGPDYTINYDTGAVTLTTAIVNANNDITTADYTQYGINSIDINLANAAAGIPVNLTPGDTLVSYQDKDSLSPGISNFGLTRLGNADADNLLESGEVFKINVNTKTFGLTDDEEFVLQVKPPQGATVMIPRRVPDRIQAVINLD